MIPLFPPSNGIDNFHEETASVFQPKQDRNSSAPPQAVKGAMDIDFMASGRWRDRKGANLVRATSTGERLIKKGGMVFSADGGALLLEDIQTGAPVVLRENIAALVVAHEWPTGGDRAFFSDGVVNFMVQAGVVKGWGLALIDNLAVDIVDGNLPAGSYLIAATPRSGPITAAGAQEGGSAPPVVYTIDYAVGLALTATVTDEFTTHVAFYCSRADQEEPLLVGVVPVTNGSAEFTLTEAGQLYWTEIPLVTINSGPPPANITAISSLQSFMLVAVGDTVYRSWAGRPGLFSLNDEFQRFPSKITTVVGLQSGAWVGTESGLYWIAGESPETWRRILVVPRPIFPEGAVLPGSAFPDLKIDGPVAAFVSENGLIVGTGSGQAALLTQFSYHFPPDIRVSIAYNEADIKQLLICQVST